MHPNKENNDMSLHVPLRVAAAALTLLGASALTTTAAHADSSASMTVSNISASDNTISGTYRCSPSTSSPSAPNGIYVETQGNGKNGAASISRLTCDGTTHQWSAPLEDDLGNAPGYATGETVQTDARLYRQVNGDADEILATENTGVTVS